MDQRGTKMDQTIESKNKALVLEAFDTLFNKPDYAAAEKFWSPRYIQHSARVLFVMGQANEQERKLILEALILEALFDLSREEVARRVQAGTMKILALAAFDYVYDIFPGAEAKTGASANPH